MIHKRITVPFREKSKIMADMLSSTITRLQESSDEECSLRSLVNSIRIELEDMRREQIEEGKKVKALKEESLKLEEMKLEAVGARNEAEEMNSKIESLKQETDSAMIAAEEAEKRLEFVIREV
ncbi:unnamed protein product [Eruca vesicaria subsp. sativa]|uniref:Uncharacterized protein n=1 Tax=Eruca vesicaria subsp. sativa TaxID=29727 RepID=A0ABC8L0I7_ERUVS|nr:unnamed protein product [Eruca vesicaria subsp. sativa]